jgi:PPM family protein phosphatase
MADLIRVRMAGLTDPGRLRGENEDRIAIHPELGLAVLADGMGGHQAGEVASGMAVDIVTQHFEHRDGQPAIATSEAQTVTEAIRKANSAIYEAGHERPDRQGMGSTVVVAAFYADRVCIGHVGDSRLYRLRDDRLEQITKDHSVVQELVNRGIFTAEEARQSVAKNLVTRALGVDPVIEPDITESAVQDGDVYLLCSDGLNDVLPDAEILRILNRHGTDLNGAVRELVDRANQGGGPDNISAIVAWISSDAIAPGEMQEI